MLRSPSFKKSLPLLLALAVLILFAVPVRVSAAVTKSYNYEDYVSSSTVSGNIKTVKVSIPVSPVRWEFYENASSYAGFRSGNNVSFPCKASTRYAVRCYPFGTSMLLNQSAVGRTIQTDALFIGNIPDGTIYELSFGVTLDNPAVFGNFSRFWTDLYLDKDGKVIKVVDMTSGVMSVINETNTSCSIKVTGTITKPKDAVYLVTGFQFHNIQSGSQANILDISFNGLDLTMDIDQLSSLADQQGETNKLLEDIQGSLETMPDEIGDEIQGVIDAEQDAAGSAGNGFVDQILGALPDPSQDVLSALKSLTDSMAYTGTDAVLPIPAIVIPGIDGLFPTTEIWSGSDFDFGEYIKLLPSSLLTLVRNLFTIAIVLYCVYELKGIISYCFTLRENKGG